MKRIVVACSIGLLAACAQVNQKIVDPLISDLAKINATIKADLVQADAVALAASPPDVDGHNCIQAVVAVQGQINAVFVAANPVGGNTGVLTTAEMASLFQPGSQQYNAAKQALTSGCAAKAQDVLGAAGVLAAGGAVGALASGQVLPLLAAVP